MVTKSKILCSDKDACTVHELTPADISVVAAIGDSITAGTGITAKTPIGLLRQDRGLSWSVGGDGNVDEHITLANMLKRYNPNLVGFSVGSGDFESENAHLNVADPGNEARNMPFQARLLVDRMKSGKEGVDFVNDWKVITMFIGGNDLCDYCGDRPEYTVEKYIGYITEALDIFHKEVPKAFVNVVEVLDIGNVPLLNENLV
ncbi:PLB [Mytilus edulis]|uniref:PLB1 n=1 Tax=Mytilus edulis TaxID=6550 RepID=A0A8S3SGN0_MYTED|nr:PLB [Mytilus edulis]